MILRGRGKKGMARSAAVFFIKTATVANGKEAVRLLSQSFYFRVRPMGSVKADGSSGVK